MACDTNADICLIIDSITEDTISAHLYETEGSGIEGQTIKVYSSDMSTVVGSATTPFGAPASVTISGLSSGTQYVIQCDGYPGTAETFSTLQSAKLYGSVNGQTKEIKKLYGSINGQTKEITKLYGSVNGLTKRIF